MRFVNCKLTGALCITRFDKKRLRFGQSDKSGPGASGFRIRFSRGIAKNLVVTMGRLPIVACCKCKFLAGLFSEGLI
jgi:hypothetical protein